MNCYIKINSTNKAKQDADQLMAGMGFCNIAVGGVGSRKVETFLRKVLTLAASLFRLRKGDVLLMQYPYKKFYAAQCRMAHLRGVRVVTLIHDLGTFRRRKLTAEQEMKRLAHSDYIIAHNDRMRSWLEERTAPNSRNGKGRIGTLGIFDYLSEVSLAKDSDEPMASNPKAPLSSPSKVEGGGDRLGAYVNAQFKNIIYAGGLGERKNAFLYDASEELEGCTLDLYGSGDLDYSRFGKNIRHHGRIGSDEFIRSVKDSWGLVWDGDSCDGCGGIWGEYLKLNNPHKCSFYLRAGLPVIVWSQSAMADFVVSNKVGFAVDRLCDIPEAVKNFSETAYKLVMANVAEMQHKLNEGFFFKKAVAEALQAI